MCMATDIVVQAGILSSSLAISNYRGLLYASLGFHGQNAIVISECDGFMRIARQIINLLGVSDSWLKRVRCVRSPVIHVKSADSTRARVSCPRYNAISFDGSLQLLW